MPTADVTTAAVPAASPLSAALAATAAPEEQPQADHGIAPLLFVFLLPMLAIVGLVLWIGSSPTWLLVGVTMATIVLMTGIVMLAINRLLADGGATH